MNDAEIEEMRLSYQPPPNERGKRRGLSKRTRFSVFARDGFACRYCGQQSDEAVLVVDHVIPVVAGGTDDMANMVTACEACNQGKAARTLEQAVPSEADQLRLAQERNEQQKAAECARDAVLARRELEQAVVDIWCDIREQDGIHKQTLAVMVSYAMDYGFERVMRWIQIANAKMPYAQDYQVGMYVSGIRRRWLKDGGD